MKIERPRLLEIIKEEIDWAKTRIPRQSQEGVPEALERGQGSLKLVAQYQNVAKGAAMQILDAAKQMEQAPSHEPASLFAPEVAKQANIVVDQLVEIEKLVLSPLQEQEEQEEQQESPWSKLTRALQESPWSKLARVLQEVEIDPKTGKYPPPPPIPDYVPEIPDMTHEVPDDLFVKLEEFLGTIAGLKLKGSDFISRDAQGLSAELQKTKGE
jgi:hypothetical protein